ncbi:MAG: DUF5522 domain-containing protein [Bacteroidota bacterium]|nr:DUF5522 domain-containing protein [Bacteroidota bacterium]
MKRLMDDDEPYTNSDGLVVFTADYLLQRGYCCGNGCRNCPYDYKAVPEPRRSLLLQKRQENELRK